MRSTEVREHLEDLAERLGIQVIYQRLPQEEFAVKGGLCKVKGSYKIFVDTSRTVAEQIEILAKSLAEFDTEQFYLFPQVREILARARRKRA